MPGVTQLTMAKPPRWVKPAALSHRPLLTHGQEQCETQGDGPGAKVLGKAGNIPLSAGKQHLPAVHRTTDARTRSALPSS